MKNLGLWNLLISYVMIFIFIYPLKRVVILESLVYLETPPDVD